MIKYSLCPTLSSVLENLKEIVKTNEKRKKHTLIFCEDRLTLVAERTICGVLGGTFLVSVFTFARFLSSEMGKNATMLTSQGSAMVIRKIIEEQKSNLLLFGKLSSAAAAGAVYDTISLLFSSKISPEDVLKASQSNMSKNKMLDISSKLHDISLIYAEYEKYLKDTGKTDRNAYLAKLPKVIENSQKLEDCDVVFLGFQSFTKAAFECVRATFESSQKYPNQNTVYGLFVGGKKEIYVNEGYLQFVEGANEYEKKDMSKKVQLPEEISKLNNEAEQLRISLFDPLFSIELKQKKQKIITDKVHIFEAGDKEEEITFIAEKILQHITSNKALRYAKISVMLPNMKEREGDIKRIFAKYNIPYYADRRHSLMEHPICAFILSYLSCTLAGCTFKDCDMVVSSPMFPIEFSERDIYRNYLLRFANYRGGIKREPNQEICKKNDFDYETVKKCREIFLSGLDKIAAKTSPKDICDGIKGILKEFDIKGKLERLSEEYKKDTAYSVIASFNGRVYDCILSVLQEAEDISIGNMSVIEFVKVLKSGFTAAEISLIPPKADAVFVGDIGSTVNAGSNIVFAASLSGAMLDGGSDTSLLTDREIAALETLDKNKLLISPKIRQVGLRRRETIALNICAFREHLYLTYSTSGDSDDGGKSEIVTLADELFCKEGESIGGEKRQESIAEKKLRQSFIREKFKKLEPIECGEELFFKDKAISPTTLEGYFACPYKNFLEKGLRVKEREVGVMRNSDAGNLIHAVLQNIAPKLENFKDENEVEEAIEKQTEKLLNEPEYASIKDSIGGEYTIDELKKESKEIGLGVYQQLKDSKFKVEECEGWCKFDINDKEINGKIDRVDSCKEKDEEGKDVEMVRVIDYKTGHFDSSPKSYYMGLKLQLPLYLNAVAKDRRAVGAYYFPAAVEYRDKDEYKFKLDGFMDNSQEVIAALDKNAQDNGGKSKYFKSSSAMDKNDFQWFLKYSTLIAKQGIDEMKGGNITPSPAKTKSGTVCDFCKLGGCCGFVVGDDEKARDEDSVKCGSIVNLVKKIEGEDNK